MLRWCACCPIKYTVFKTYICLHDYTSCPQCPTALQFLHVWSIKTAFFFYGPLWVVLLNTMLFLEPFSTEFTLDFLLQHANVCMCAFALMCKTVEYFTSSAAEASWVLCLLICRTIGREWWSRMIFPNEPSLTESFPLCCLFYLCLSRLRQMFPCKCFLETSDAVCLLLAYGSKPCWPSSRLKREEGADPPGQMSFMESEGKE